jgi:predicted permease
MNQADLIYRIIAIIFPIFVIVIIGYVYSRKIKPDMSSGNRINMDLFTPALIFDIMSSSNYAISEYGQLMFGGFFVVMVSGLLAWPVAKWCGYQWKTFIPPMMFSNSGNMGVPLILLTFGEKALPAAILLFATENFLHFLLGQQLITQRWSFAAVFKNPMIIATIAGISFSLLSINLPETIRFPIHMLGQVSIPLMLFSLGARLLSIDINDWKIGTMSALVCPLSGLIAAILVIPFLDLSKEHLSILILFAALPPAVLNYMVAEKFNQQPQLVASIVLIGNLGSVIFIPATLWFVL